MFGCFYYYNKNKLGVKFIIKFLLMIFHSTVTRVLVVACIVCSDYIMGLVFEIIEMARPRANW